MNRLLMPMVNEAFFALMEGVATAEDIDRGMKLGTNHPMGPLTLADFIGALQLVLCDCCSSALRAQRSMHKLSAGRERSAVTLVAQPTTSTSAVPGLTARNMCCDC